MSMTTISTRVDRLHPGDTVVGTGASGPFEDGPRVLESRTKAPEHSQRTTAWWCVWEAGGHNVFYGDTMVDVSRVKRSETELALAGGLTRTDAARIVHEAVETFGLTEPLA